VAVGSTCVLTAHLARVNLKVATPQCLIYLVILGFGGSYMARYLLKFIDTFEVLIRYIN
jgi:hypothetical protein